MSPELENKLIEKYPTLFKDKDKSPKESLMCFGCEFSDGWYKIFDDLCAYLTRLSRNEMLLRLKEEFKDEGKHGYIYIHYPTISFTQVKEKYGTIRVYWIGNGIENYDNVKEKLHDLNDLESQVKCFYDRVDHAIDFTEFLSSKVCEECGEPGKLYTNGWYMTKCKRCIVDHYGFDPDENDTNEN